MKTNLIVSTFLMLFAIASQDALAFRTVNKSVADPEGIKTTPKPAVKKTLQTAPLKKVSSPAASAKAAKKSATTVTPSGDKEIVKKPITKKVGTTKLSASKTKQVGLEKMRLDAEYKKRMEQSAMAVEESKKRELEMKKRNAESTPPQPALEIEQYSANVANSWEKFKSSIKQGGTVGCSDAEKALNHCVQ